MKNAALAFSDYVFDSEFESGNLDKVFIKSTNKFELILTPDSNTKGHTQ